MEKLYKITQIIFFVLVLVGLIFLISLFTKYTYKSIKKELDGWNYKIITENGIYFDDKIEIYPTSSGLAGCVNLERYKYPICKPYEIKKLK